MPPAKPTANKSEETLNKDPEFGKLPPAEDPKIENNEKKEAEDAKPTASDVALDVLNGKYGYNTEEALDKVGEAGHDAREVRTALRTHIASGKPSKLVI